DSEDKSDNGGNDDDAINDDNQEGDDMNDNDGETDKEKEKIDDEETMDDEEDDEVTKELYKDVNVNLGNEDTEMTNADQGGLEQQNVSQESGFEQVKEDAHVILTPVLDAQKTDEPVQSSCVSFDFTSKLLNLENPSPADNEIASLMETSARQATTVPEITPGFTTTIPLPPPFFNLLPQQATPTPITSKVITSFTSLMYFSFVFKFNDRVTNLEKDLEAINKAIQAHNLDCRQEAQDEKNEYIGLVDTSMRTIIKEEVTTQLPQILPQAVLDFSTLVIEKNVTESLEAVVLARKANHILEQIKKKKLYDALVESYKTDKDLFNTYSEVFTLKRSQDDRDKDQDPSDGSDRGTKQRTLSKEAESSRDSRSKEKKSSSTSKDASQSQRKHSGKSAHAKEPSHTIDDSGVQQDQEFDKGNNDEQPADKEVSKADWFKKPERPPTLNSD
ncbi:hypothetical protein Tco_1494844, partial [Tanacetum coccineum]